MRRGSLEAGGRFDVSGGAHSCGFLMSAVGKWKQYPELILTWSMLRNEERRKTEKRSTGGELQYLNKFWNKITGPSNAGCAPANIFAHSGELGARSPAMKRFI
jgi:hypothetical protein